jgi:hypothetical protein
MFKLFYLQASKEMVLNIKLNFMSASYNDDKKCDTYGESTTFGIISIGHNIREC